MAKTNQNDTFYANNIRNFQFNIMNSNVTPNVPLNIIGYTIQWALSRVAPSGSFSTTPFLKKDTAELGGITVQDAPNGIVIVNLLEADTAGLSGSFYHELQVVDGEGNAVVVATGTLTIIANILTPGD